MVGEEGVEPSTTRFRTEYSTDEPLPEGFILTLQHKDSSENLG